MRKTKFWKWITNIKVISVLIVVAATGMGVLGVHQAQEYERSTLAIYAEQQDAYVQLVLDQIAATRRSFRISSALWIRPAGSTGR